MFAPHSVTWQNRNNLQCGVNAQRIYSLWVIDVYMCLNLFSLGYYYGSYNQEWNHPFEGTGVVDNMGKEKGGEVVITMEMSHLPAVCISSLSWSPSHPWNVCWCNSTASYSDRYFYGFLHWANAGIMFWNLKCSCIPTHQYFFSCRKKRDGELEIMEQYVCVFFFNFRWWSCKFNVQLWCAWEVGKILLCWSCFGIRCHSFNGFCS